MIRSFASVSRRYFKAGLFILLAGFLASCGKRETPVQQATKAGIMIIGNGAEPSDLDPQVIVGIPERDIVSSLFEGLTKLEPATLEPLPGAAESWEISSDHLVYTFHLRSGATWSDGTPLTMRDFYNSFRRQLTPELASANADQLYLVVNAEDYQQGRLKDFSQVGFKLIDERTLQIHLLYPASFLLKTMAARSWFPVPFHVLEKFGDPYKPGNRWTRAGNLVGNGPFTLKEWVPNSYIEVAKNPRYWNQEKVRLNGIRFLPIESFSSEEAAFRSGQLHKTYRLPSSKIAVYRKTAPQLLHIHAYAGVYFYTFNVNRAPFTDVRVRQALAMAVDRESLIRNVTLGGETPAYHFTLEGIGGYVSEARTKLDFDEARRLLAEAGFPGGKGLPPITLLFNTAENHRALAEALQQTWQRELGIDLRLENQEWKVYLDNMHQQNFQLCRSGMIMEPFDASQLLKTFTHDSGFNYTGWSDPEYDRLYEEVMRTADIPARIKLMQRMEKILTDAMPILPIYYYSNQYLMDPSVHGWVDNLLTLAAYDRVWLE